MSRDYFVMNAGRSVFRGGFYLEEDAEKFAQGEARRHPGRLYTVLHRTAAFQFPRPTKKA